MPTMRPEPEGIDYMGIEEEYKELDKLGIRDRFCLEVRGLPTGCDFPLRCPGCGSLKTAYSAGFQEWVCHSCGGLFELEDTYE